MPSRKTSTSSRRDITNQWLHVEVPALNNSNLSELREAGSRLTNEWKSKKRDRETFWPKVVVDEEEEGRIRYLKAAGEKRLKAAEGFLVAESQHRFGSTQAGRKHFRGSLDNEHSSPSKSPRIRDCDRGFEDSGGSGSLRDENGDEDNNGEAVDDDDVESIEDLANEVVELIEKSEPGFHPLIRSLYHAVRGTPLEKPMAKPELSAEQSFLYDFVWNSVDMFHDLPTIKKKDLLKHRPVPPVQRHPEPWCTGPNNSTGEKGCLEAYREYVDDYGDAKEARLIPLKKRLEKDLSLFDGVSDEKIVVEILLILVKLSMPDQYRRPKLTETSAIVVWSNIWTILFESTPVFTILREAQKDQLAVRKIVGAGAAKGAKGVSGRRLDFRLVVSVKVTQASSEFVSVTLCNNEHKAPDVDAQTFNILHRKNNRLNKSVVANGLVTRTGPTVFLDVQVTVWKSYSDIGNTYYR
ncbi:hypothetical protein BGX27_009691 [Mortierella sp. AM989]|nr:hypothetical protein BGX27_009691 [Mortierella sp. AM989]